MTDEPEVIRIPVQWDGVTFPASRGHIGRFVLVSLHEIMRKEERDVYRHLVDDDSTGWLYYVPDNIDPSTQIELAAKPAQLMAKSSTGKFKSASQEQRFWIECIWEEGTDQSQSKEDYYQSLMAVHNQKLRKKLDDIRRDKHYEGRV